MLCTFPDGVKRKPDRSVIHELSRLVFFKPLLIDIFRFLTQNPRNFSNCPVEGTLISFVSSYFGYSTSNPLLLDPHDEKGELSTATLQLEEKQNSPLASNQMWHYAFAPLRHSDQWAVSVGLSEGALKAGTTTEATTSSF